MLKRLVAVILALVIVLGVMEKPAYAYSENSLLMNLEANSSGSLYEMSSQNAESDFAKLLKWIGKKAGGAAITFGTPIAICLTADAAASTVFPPAAALLPYCAALKGVVAGGTALKGVKAVTELAH